MNYPFLTSRGFINNLHALPGIKTVEKFGRNTAIASGATEDIWDGSSIYTFLTTGVQHNIKSDSVNDTLLGTGARKADIHGLDENWLLSSEQVELNGTTNVLTANKYLRIFRMYVAEAGSGNINVGNIDAVPVGGTPPLTARITASVGQTNMAIYTIPERYDGYLTKWYATLNRRTGVNGVACDVDIFRHDYLKSVYRSTQPIGIQNNGQGHWIYEFPHPLFLESKTDLLVSAVPTAVADITAGFSVILIPK